MSNLTKKLQSIVGIPLLIGLMLAPVIFVNIWAREGRYFDGLLLLGLIVGIIILHQLYYAIKGKAVFDRDIKKALTERFIYDGSFTRINPSWQLGMFFGYPYQIFIKRLGIFLAVITYPPTIEIILFRLINGQFLLQQGLLDALYLSALLIAVANNVVISLLQNFRPRSQGKRRKKEIALGVIIVANASLWHIFVAFKFFIVTI